MFKHVKMFVFVIKCTESFRGEKSGSAANLLGSFCPLLNELESRWSLL